MNDTVKEIVAILEHGRPELQVAAAQILGELRPKDAAVGKALASAATRSNVLGRYAIEALARYGTPEALRVVVRVLCENDTLADQAMHLLAEAGEAAHPEVAAAFADAPADRRARLLQVLSRPFGKDSVRPFAQALTTPDLSESAARILQAASDTMSPALRKAVRDELASVLEAPLPEQSSAAVLAVLARVDANGAKNLLWKQVGEDHPPAVRSAALRALCGQKLTAVQVKGLLAELEDAGKRDVHDAIREVLGAMPEWPDGLVPVLKRMLAGRNPEHRLFALRALRTTSSPDLVKLALKLRDHADARFRAAAEDVLASSKHAVEPLLRLLQSCKDPVEGPRLAGLLVRHGEALGQKQVKAIAERSIKLMPTNALAGDLLCDVAIRTGGQKLLPLFLDKAVRWRRSKRYPEALHLLAKLAQAQLLDGEGQYQLALTRFLQDLQRPAHAEAAPGNAAMGFFAVLLRDGFPLFDRLKKETSLQPEHLLRLATHFSEAVGPERRFGAELLQHLAARNKGRAGEEARYALRAAGF